MAQTDNPPPTNGTLPTTTEPPLQTTFLIIGSGPAGASLACFLARLGHKGIMINRDSSTATTPRAHITNMAALECLRDIDLYDECHRLGNHGLTMKNFRWCESMAGEEYARNATWGNGERAGDFQLVSPCEYMDLPQSVLEPVLVRYAGSKGFTIRFDTEFLELLERSAEGNLVRLFDRVAKREILVKAKYVFGADGGRSRVIDQLGLPMTQIPGGGLAYNVLVKANMEHLMAHREGNLHSLIRLHRDYPFLSVARMVKPWHEWMFVFVPKGPHAPSPERSHEEWKEIIADLIDDATVNVDVIGVNKWFINETYANVISKDNVFCLGDAIHRHPPTGGLGSNTAIQDAFNLSWKLHYVETFGASPSLLDTYNTERQPVAAQLVTRSNEILRAQIRVFQALGAAPYGSSEADRLRGYHLLRENSKEGSAARKELKESVEWMTHETGGLGMEFGQLYTSPAVFASDEPSAFAYQGKEVENSWRYYTPGTYPGRRLPHAWLGKSQPGPKVSTLDLAGKGRFTLFVGVGGKGWREAAKGIKGVEVVGVGFGLEWEDVYLRWAEVKGIEDDGCVLVRPDLFVAWRAKEGGGREDCGDRLGKAMKAVLGL